MNVHMAFLALFACLCARLSHATEPHALPDMHHTTWSIQESAPADVWALAQAEDGYLWLGTGFGLYRFDGVSFEPVELNAGQSYASTSITALSILQDGTTWIGYFGGLSRLKNGNIQHFGKDAGIPTATIYRIAQDNSGTVWAATSSGLAYLASDRWQLADARMGFPWRQADWVMRDSHGTLWVANGQSLAFRPAGVPLFREAAVPSRAFAVLAEAADGSIWLSDELHGTRPVASYREDGALRIQEQRIGDLESLVAKRMLLRADGTIWGTDAVRGGVFRARPHPDDGGRYQIEHFGQAQGLVSDMAVPVLEDREGNVWAGSNMGLNRFRRRNVFMLPGIGGINYGSYGLFDMEGADVAVLTPDRQFRAGRNVLRLAMSGRHASENDITDAPWLIDVRGLWRLQAGRRQLQPVPAGQDAADISAGAIDATGTPWISFYSGGVYRLSAGKWLRDTRVSPDQGATVIVPGTDGSLWLGYERSRVTMIRGEEVAQYDAADGLKVGDVTAIHADGDHVVVAGGLGLAALTRKGFRTLGGSRASMLLGISGIVAGDDGALWLNGNRGIVRIGRDELQRALLEPAYAPDYRVFDAFDGLAGIALQSVPVPTAARGANGLLWFATNQGIAVIDPLDITRNAISPLVLVRELAAGESILRHDAHIELPATPATCRSPIPRPV